ncbi:Cell wall-associated hydrolase, partial [human gut metagenome]
TFYPLSDDPPTRDRRITSSYFRTCLTRRSRSQAPLCTYTQHLVADQAEGTFERLRYILGGNRPS